MQVEGRDAPGKRYARDRHTQTRRAADLIMDKPIKETASPRWPLSLKWVTGSLIHPVANQPSWLLIAYGLGSAKPPMLAGLSAIGNSLTDQFLARLEYGAVYR